MRKPLAVLGSALSLTLGLAPSVAVADGSTSPSPASPGTAAPLDASGVPVVTPEQKIDPYVRSSIVYIKIHWQAWPVDRNGRNYVFTDNDGAQYVTLDSQCTGYVVNPDGWIATAGHCVSYTEARAGFIDKVTDLTYGTDYFVPGTTKTQVHDYWFDNLKTESSDATGATGRPDRSVSAYWGANVSGLQATNGRSARVMDYQEFEEGDGALLKVNESDMNALLLVPGDTTVDTGTSVAAIGYAGSVQSVTDADFHPSVKTGTVSAQKTRHDIPVYEIDAAVSPGMSGGPTVNDQGQAIGTNSFGPPDEPQSFNFVGTSQRILELLNSQGADNELSQDSQDMRAGLDAYFAGDKATAVAKLSAVKENQPSNDVVTDYLARAKALPDPAPEGDSGGVPTWLWVVAAALLLLAIAAAVVVLVQARRRRPDDRPGHGATGVTPATPSPPRSAAPAASATPGGAPTMPMAPPWSDPASRPVPTPEPAGAGAGPGASPGAGPGGAGQPQDRSDAATAVRPVPTGFGAGAPPPEPSAPVGSGPASEPRPGQPPSGQEPQEEVASSRFCTSCGALSAPRQKFCGACGNRL